MSSVTFKIVNSRFKNIRFRVGQVCSIETTKRETDRVRPCPTESIRQHFTPSVNTSLYFSKSLAIGLRSDEPTQTGTGRVRPCPMESIRQHFTPSVNTSLYFSKSLAIGLPVSRTVAYPRRSDSVRVYWTCMSLRRGRFTISSVLSMSSVLTTHLFFPLLPC